MRIISGSHKGRIIKMPKKYNARPTTDVAKEALFNILKNDFNFSEIIVADLFGGTGSISYEFASRGVDEIFCIEMNPVNFRFIKDTIKEMKFSGIKVYRNNAFDALKRMPKNHFNIVFADPPFDMKTKTKLIDLVFDMEILNNGVFILEHSDKENYTSHPKFFELRKYGKVNFCFFK